MEENVKVEEKYIDLQSKMINEIIEVFERNDASVFDVYRVSAILYNVSKEQARVAFADLSEQLDSLLEALDVAKDALEELDSE